MKLFNDTFTALERSLDYSSAKNRAISDNIANVDTPGYKAKNVVFKDVLNRELSTLPAKRTDPRHIDFQRGHESSYRTMTRPGTTYNHNGNNVDIDKEMNDLAQNQIYYQALADRMNGKFRSLQSVIKGGN
ncbi:flagellar basal body rod protein FlgB [Halobacillus yeomjeoni]|uniref:Flagellar basal body rod protein FlgB n=1 Tax=Halobacillus yeomjeoni TaxID=311194 RepID=A0A931HTQ0_9BACI|nr:flagellar basal body rod protein FlgB [Halobacillus yeomjeoni]MBH0229266.1 flagellar basal body rod protein FlgB [Halobacillus yeomjeoni]MCA0983335.1 flagellar basal body rod protein FlgB [Halobacillus yeomjeoni]